jgi:hypothetical protein
MPSNHSYSLLNRESNLILHESFHQDYSIYASKNLGGIWFPATFCQAKVWLAIKVWLKNMKPNFDKSWQEQ